MRKEKVTPGGKPQIKVEYYSKVTANKAPFSQAVIP